VGGATLLAAPLWVLGVIGASLALATVLWGVWPGHERTATFWVVVVAATVVSLVAFVAARGCFVEVRDGQVRDVVGWVTVHRVDRRRIVAARVARGAWRWFVLELDDGSRVTLVGASPLQFPARLTPGATDADLADLDDLLGPDATG
jgi:hypothetical protein